MDGKMFDGLFEAILIIGISIGSGIFGLGWALWHFVLSYITIGWN